MKILKKSTKIKCQFCRSKFQFNPDEVIEKANKYSDSNLEECISYVKCPICKGYMILSKTLI